MITPDNIFIGNEIEGPDIGIKTIFIPKGKALAVKDALYHYILEQDIKRLYFGAGNTTGLTEGDISVIGGLLNLEPDVKIHAEIEPKDLAFVQTIPNFISRHINFILVLRDKRLIRPFNTIKFVNDNELFWHTTNSVHHTPLDHKEYGEDTILNL